MISTSHFASSNRLLLRKAGVAFHEKMGILKRTHYSIFAKYPVDVRNSFEEINLNKALEAKNLDAVAEIVSFLDQSGSENNELINTFEKLIGLFCKEIDGLEKDDPACHTKTKKIGSDLGEAIRKIAHHVKIPAFKQDLYKVASVVGCQPLPDDPTMETSISLIMSAPKQLLFRTLHETKAGEGLLHLATCEQQRLASLRDANKVIKEAEQAFSEMYSDEVLSTFWNSTGMDTEDKKVEKIVREIKARCSGVLQIFTPDNVEASTQNAIDAFLKFSEHAIQNLVGCLASTLGNFSEFLTGGKIIDVQSAEWIALGDEHMKFFAQMLAMFCAHSDSPGRLLLAVKAGELLPTTTLAAMEEGIAILSCVTCFLLVRRCCVRQCFLIGFYFISISHSMCMMMIMTISDHDDDDAAADVVSVINLPLHGQSYSPFFELQSHITHLLLTKTCLPDPATLIGCSNVLHG